MKKKTNRVQFTLFLLLMFLGFLLSAKFTNTGYAGSYLEHQDQEDLLTIWKDLETKQTHLRQELTDLQEQKKTLTQAANADSTAVTNIQAQRDMLYQINGQVPVKGPGVEVVFSGETPLLYLDLVDIVNELWASGAEAVAVNKERVTASTSFYYTETDSRIYLTANGNILHYPITIKAVGDRNTLEKGLTFPGGIVDNLSTLYNIKPNIKKVDDLELPARKNSEPIVPGWIGVSRTLLKN